MTCRCKSTRKTTTPGSARMRLASSKLGTWSGTSRIPACTSASNRTCVKTRSRELLASDGDLSARMAFTPVSRGDFVVLDPGTPHAVGRGVTLLEPQAVKPLRRAVTYRYWDWRRRYDARGRPDASGEPRAVHVRDALAVTRWERAADPLWLASRMRRFGWPDAREPARCETLCAPGPGDALQCARLRVARLCGTGALRVPAWNALRALTVIEGRVRLGRGAGAQALPAGSSAAIPAALARSKSSSRAPTRCLPRPRVDAAPRLGNIRAKLTPPRARSTLLESDQMNQTAPEGHDRDPDLQRGGDPARGGRST